MKNYFINIFDKIFLNNNNKYNTSIINLIIKRELPKWCIQVDKNQKLINMFSDYSSDSSSDEL